MTSRSEGGDSSLLQGRGLDTPANSSGRDSHAPAPLPDRVVGSPPRFGRRGKIGVIGGLALGLLLAGGATAQTEPVLMRDINPSGTSLINSYLTDVNGILLFSARDGSTGAELWKSDGTPGGTVQVKDIEPGANGANLHYLTAVGDTLFFNAWTSSSGAELWKSDGTEGGTTLVKDIFAGPLNSNPHNLTNVAGTLFFQAYGDAAYGSELWKSDGTAGGTVMVKDIYPGPTYGTIYPPVDFGGTLYFSADASLWRSDGTEGGTVVVMDFVDVSPLLLTVVGDALFFKIDYTELWTSDGTAGGTHLVKDVRPAATTGSFLGSFTAVGDTLFFWADDGVTGDELWKSDGTEVGTFMLKDIRPGGDSSYPRNLINANGTLSFAAHDGTNAGLWKSDGTENGTVMVKDVPVSSSEPASIAGTVYFGGDDYSNGTEPWMSDGTTDGTVHIGDIYPAGNSSNPKWFTVSGSWLFFSADDGLTGGELWAYPLPTGIFSDGFESGNTSVWSAVAGGP